jgi:hypothetical protein
MALRVKDVWSVAPNGHPSKVAPLRPRIFTESGASIAAGKITMLKPVRFSRWQGVTGNGSPRPFSVEKEFRRALGAASPCGSSACPWLAVGRSRFYARRNRSIGGIEVPTWPSRHHSRRAGSGRSRGHAEMLGAARRGRFGRPVRRRPQRERNRPPRRVADLFNLPRPEGGASSGSSPRPTGRVPASCCPRTTDLATVPAFLCLEGTVQQARQTARAESEKIRGMGLRLTKPRKTPLPGIGETPRMGPLAIVDTGFSVNGPNAAVAPVTGKRRDRQAERSNLNATPAVE